MKGGDPHAVGVGEPQLRARMGSFLAQDQPGAGRPAAQVDQSGGLGDPGAVAEPTCGVDRRVPALGEVEGVHGVLHPPIDGVAEGEPHPGSVAGVGEVVSGPGGIAAHQNLRPVGIIATTRVGSPRRGQRRQRLLQDDDGVTGGMEPALPVRSSPARPSPPAISGRSRNASSGWCPNDFFQVGVAPILLSEWSITNVASCRSHSR